MEEELSTSSIRILLIILVLSGFLFSSCKNRRTNDYSLFPQGTIFSGNLKTGNAFYFIREDSVKMAGVCFVDNNKAVAETISFYADSIGATTFIYRNETFSGKMIINPPSSEIELTLPEITSLAIRHQTIHLKYFNKITQTIDCHERYKNPVFDNIASTKNIQYGTALGYYTSKPMNYISKDDYVHWFEEMFKTYKGAVMERGMVDLPLYFDIYQPENDNLNKRPLLLFIHGGAFFFGDKENKTQHVLTDYLVKRGYVVASINYRLGSSLLGTDAIERTIYREVQDTRAALRYLVSDKDEFGIDTRQIYLAGSSAGGIVALTTAFMDNDEVYSSIGERIFHLRENLGGLDDSGNNIKESFNIAGVVSLWGGVTDLKILDNPIPTLLFHGTDDDIIPCDKGLPFKKYMGNTINGLFSFAWRLYGSESIHDCLTSLNISSKYVPFPGCGHEAQIDPDGTLNEKMDIICEETGNFLYDNVSKQYFDFHLSGDTVVGKNDSTPVYQLDNLGNTSVQWQVEGGLITKQTNDAMRVVWYSSHKTGTVAVCITNKNGVSCRKELKVKINT